MVRNFHRAHRAWAAVTAHRVQPRGATPRPRSGAAAKRSDPASEVRSSSQDCQAAIAQEQPRGASHIRGQGQKPGGPYARGAAAKRSYPTSEVRGSGLECQAAMAQERPRGATPCLRSGEAAGRSYPTAQGQGQRPGGATPCPRPGVAARRTNPMSKEWWLHVQEGLEELSHVEGQEGQQ